MTTHYLNSEGLYLLSGPQGAGKSHLIKKIKATHPECIISFDNYRQQLLGKYDYVEEGNPDIDREFLYGWTQGESTAISVAKQAVRVRCENKLPTIVDAMNLTDDDRKKFAKVAQDNGVNFEVLILDTEKEEILSNNQNRAKIINENVILETIENFEKTSRFDYRVVSNNDNIEFKPLTLTHDKIDIIGDVHGLYDDFVQLIENAGYIIDEKMRISHPDNRTLVFVGDIVDRGPDSLKMLEMAQKNTKNHYFLLGNHEVKLINYFQRHVFGKDKKEELRGSFSSMETFNILLKEPKGKQKAIYEMVLNWPCRLEIDVEKNGIKEKIGVVHANSPIFDPIYMPRNACVYGSQAQRSVLNTDEAYDLNYEHGKNTHILFRGHIPAMTSQKSRDVRDINSKYIFSLDAKQAFAGQLVLLPLDKFLDKKNEFNSYNKAFKESVITYDVNFDFALYEEKARQLTRDIRAAVKNDWVKKTVEPDYGMQIYKFSRKVFWDALWDKSYVLKKTRGLVLDCVGQIVQHPFDKTFNYGEKDAGKQLSLDHKIRAVEKINGFLGCVTKHPYEDRLLLTTTGSFDSDFVGYIEQAMTAKERNIMKNYLNKNDVTLMFEVVHPEDPHIIKYDEKDHGLWLIGARTKGKNDPIFTESELDHLAEKLDLKRSKHKITTVGEILKEGKTSDLEGWLIRDAKNDDVLFKLKTSYYLVTKFVGRMGKKKVGHMFGNPENFKKTLDEEFLFLVDLIHQSVSKDEFEAMQQNDRVSFVRDLIDNNIDKQFDVVINDNKKNKKKNRTKI